MEVSETVDGSGGGAIEPDCALRLSSEVSETVDGSGPPLTPPPLIEDDSWRVDVSATRGEWAPDLELVATR